MGKYLSYSGLSTFLDLLKTTLRGHTIKNSAGTDMTQRANLQFTGDVSVSDDSTNDRTIIEVSGGGHTIWNRIKTSLTKRSRLWFKDAKTSDDSTEDATAIEVISSVTESAFDSLPTDGSADGLYELSDGDFAPLTGDEVAYDNNDTINDKIDGLIEDATDKVTWYANGILGAKQLIPYPYYHTTKTENGITWTDNGDGTVTANGTATARSEFAIRSRVMDSFKLPVGEYLLSGCAPNGGTGKWAMATYYTTPSNTGANLVFDYGLTGDRPLNITNEMMSQYFTLGISLVIQSGITVENLVFKPMLRLAEDTDNTYQPYAKTNKELTDELKGKVDWATNGILGAKNLIPFPYTAPSVGTYSNLSTSYNKDGIISINGTATNNVYYAIKNNINGDDPWYLDAGTYILSIHRTGTISSHLTVSLQNRVEQTMLASIYVSNTEFDDSITFTLTERSEVTLRWSCARGEVITNVELSVMLRLAEDLDSEYQPYAKTNRELTVDKAEQSEVDDIFNVYGAKQMIVYPYQESTVTRDGITYTDNGDGTITANGTATANANFYIGTLKPIKKGTYTLTNGLNNSPTTYKMRIRLTTDHGTTYSSVDLNDEKVTFTVKQDCEYNIYLWVVSGVSVSNLTFEPLLTPASVTNRTFEPYAETNYQLTHSKLSYKDNGVLGAKNALVYPYANTSRTINGITFTDNGDGTITVSGTATADANFSLTGQKTGNPFYGYILSGCPANGGASTYRIRHRIANGSIFISDDNDFGDGVVISKTEAGYTCEILLLVRNGTTLSSPITFKPMLRLSEDTDNTYQPYAMTNKQLTDKIATKEDIIPFNTFSITASNWVANSDSATSGDYPYVYSITTDKYTADSTPIWDLAGAGVVPTSTERTSIDMILEAVFSASKITLYATDKPTSNLTLRVKGK